MPARIAPVPNKMRRTFTCAKLSATQTVAGNRQHPALDRRAAESPERLQNHGNHHRLDAVKQRRNGRQMPKAHIRPGDDSHQDGRWRNKARAADDEARPPGAQIADVNGEFAGAGTGNQAACAEQVEKFFAGKPFPAPHQFVFHDGDVRRRPAKRGDAQPQKEKRQFFQRSALRRASCACVSLLEFGHPRDFLVSMGELSGASPDALECSALRRPKYTFANLSIPRDLSRTGFSLWFSFGNGKYDMEGTKTRKEEELMRQTPNLCRARLQPCR